MMINRQPIHVCLQTAADTAQLGETLGRSLFAGSVLLLEGDLGSGKTTLVQGMGRGLGITDDIVSPTFTLINEYLEGRIPLYHMDLYRLDPQDVDELYLEAYWQGDEFPLGIVAIEWAERLSQLPPCYLQIRLSHADAGRQVELLPNGNDEARWDEVLQSLNKTFPSTAPPAAAESHPE